MKKMLPGDFVFIALLAGLLVLVGIYYMQHQSNRSFVNEQLARAQNLWNTGSRQKSAGIYESLLDGHQAFLGKHMATALTRTAEVSFSSGEIDKGNRWLELAAQNELDLRLENPDANRKYQKITEKRKQVLEELLEKFPSLKEKASDPVPDGVYRIVKDAVGCRIRGDLDLVQDCFKKADDGALKDLIGRHRCMELKKGTKVSLLDDTYNWGWYRVRPMGTADVLFIDSDAVQMGQLDRLWHFLH